MIYVQTDINDKSIHELQEALGLLPDWRRAAALKYKHLQGQKECVYSYLLLCDALQREYGINTQPHFLIGEHGKPTLQEFPHIHFNLSHCKVGVAVALSDAPVGIDIECVGRGNDSLMRHVLSQAEYELVQTAPEPSLEFTKFWTMKEAVVKLTGQGLGNSVKELLMECDNVKIETRPYPNLGCVVSIARYRFQQIMED